MWNVKVARPSDRRAARLFWEAIVCGKVAAFCDFMYFMSSTLDDIKRFVPAMSPE